MINLKKYIVFIFLFSVLYTKAQEAWEVDPMPIRLKGKIISMGDNLPVPYAHVVNNRTHGGMVSNAGGFFTMDMLNIDSLSISVLGYFKETFGLPADYHSDSILVFRMRPVSFTIRQVDVQGEKPRVNLDGVPSGKPVDIPPELRGDAFNERPPVIAALFNPISFWTYYLSKSEKRKRAVREAISLEENWEMHSQNYNKEVVMSLTGLNESDADSFMIWFNIQGVLPYTSTDYEVRAAIRQYFAIYKAQKGME